MTTCSNRCSSSFSKAINWRRVWRKFVKDSVQHCIHARRHRPIVVKWPWVWWRVSRTWTRCWDRHKTIVIEFWWRPLKIWKTGSSRCERSRPFTTPWICSIWTLPKNVWLPSAGFQYWTSKPFSWHCAVEQCVFPSVYFLFMNFQIFFFFRIGTFGIIGSSDFKSDANIWKSSDI